MTTASGGSGTMLKELTTNQIKQIIVISERLDTQISTGVFNVTDGNLSLKLRECLYSLSADGMMELRAIIWMGRGDYSDFDAAMAHARTNANPVGEDGSAITGHLRKGAALMGLDLAD